jgi:MinD superfamily P-loop ATPase
VRFCEYGALALAGSSVLVFEDLCHACGGCARICPVGAVTEVESRIGLLYQGGDETLGLSYGELAIGRTLAPPLIRAAKDAARSDVLRIVDAPPGTTCPMVAAIRDADFVVLVTENTPFGIHDLNLAAEVIRDLGIPCGAVINRSDIGSSADRSTAAYCRENGIEVLLEIPFDPAIAEAYATGGALIDAGGHYRRMFEDLNNLIRDRVRATT